MLETARVLLRLEKVRALIEKAEIFDLESAQPSAGGAWIVGRGGERSEIFGSGEVQGRSDYEEEEAELSWKIGRLMEMFLSNEIQVR